MNRYVKSIFYIKSLTLREVNILKMSIETRKLRLIEDFVKIRDHVLLDKIEALLKHKPVSTSKTSLDKFVGIWSKEEADEIKKIIAEGCEQIHEEDW
jgi:hypothetical protein